MFRSTTLSPPRTRSRSELFNTPRQTSSSSKLKSGSIYLISDGGRRCRSLRLTWPGTQKKTVLTYFQVFNNYQGLAICCLFGIYNWIFQVSFWLRNWSAPSVSIINVTRSPWQHGKGKWQIDNANNPQCKRDELTNSRQIFNWFFTMVYSMKLKISAPSVKTTSIKYSRFFLHWILQHVNFKLGIDNQPTSRKTMTFSF